MQNSWWKDGDRHASLSRNGFLPRRSTTLPGCLAGTFFCDWNILRNHKQVQGKAAKRVQEFQKKLHEEELKDLRRHPGESSGGTRPLSSNIQSAIERGRSSEFWEAPKDRTWTRKQKLPQSKFWLHGRKTFFFNDQGHPRMGLAALEEQELPVMGGNQAAEGGCLSGTAEFRYFMCYWTRRVLLCSKIL